MIVKSLPRSSSQSSCICLNGRLRSGGVPALVRQDRRIGRDVRDLRRTFSALVADGAAEWINLLVLLCLWNAVRFTIIGPVSLIVLRRAREAVTVREERRATTELSTHTF